MDFTAITFDQIVLAMLIAFAIHELLIAILPDRIAGPGGWLIDTATGEQN